jgi:hypothetical protein
MVPIDVEVFLIGFDGGGGYAHKQVRRRAPAARPAEGGGGGIQGCGERSGAGGREEARPAPPVAAEAPLPFSPPRARRRPRRRRPR